MNLICYPKLSTCSKRALIKQTGKYGRPYQYVPRGNLLERLSQELNLTIEQVYHQLLSERDYLLRR